ncbi:MAG TPA: alpha/beta fold hydrolase [Candidatus Nitrosotalea sp.]|nr:alpha/beta fold hydrolase [Candidatus Nitrosotalea sp.]
MTLQSGFVQCGPIRLHHLFGGSGEPALVFVHGLGSAGFIEWRSNLDPMAMRHRVYAPDLPGFGRSDKPRGAYGVEFFARALEDYMQALGISGATMVGASLGGRVALELALNHPHRVKRLVLVNSVGLGRPRPRPYYPLLVLPALGELLMRATRLALWRAPAGLILGLRRRATGAHAESAPDPEYLGQLREMHDSPGFARAYLATLRSLAAPFRGGVHDLRSRLHEIAIPVLLVWGAGDTLLPLRHALLARDLIAGAELRVIASAGHSPHRERSGEFNRVLLDFAG